MFIREQCQNPWKADMSSPLYLGLYSVSTVAATDLPILLADPREAQV